MSEYRVASRYAKSLLELAEEEGVLDEVNADMQSFTRLCKQNRDFVLMLKNPIVKHDRKLAIFKALFEEKFNKVTHSIFLIITRKHREGVLPAIAEEFHRQYNQRKGIQRATITTAAPVDEALKKEFLKVLGEISNKTIELETIVNDKVIGGFHLRIGDQQIDDTIKGKLDALALKFKEHVYID